MDGGFFKYDLTDAVAFWDDSEETSKKETSSSQAVTTISTHPQAINTSPVSITGEKRPTLTRPPLYPSNKTSEQVNAPTKQAVTTQNVKRKRTHFSKELSITPNHDMANAINLSLSTDRIACEIRSYAPLTVFALATDRTFGPHLPTYSFSRKGWVYIDARASFEKLISAVKAMPIRTYLYLEKPSDDNALLNQINLIKHMPPYTVLLLDDNMSTQDVHELIRHLQENVELGIGDFKPPFSSTKLTIISENTPKDAGLYFHNSATEEIIDELLKNLGPQRTVRADPWMSVNKKNFIIEKTPRHTTILCTQDTPPGHIKLMDPYIKQSKARFFTEKMQKDHVERTEEHTAASEGVNSGVNSGM